MWRKFLIVFIICLIVTITCKDVLITACVSFLLRQEFGRLAKIGKISISHKKITIDDLSVIQEDFIVKLKSGLVGLKFSGLSMPYISDINLEDLVIEARKTKDSQDMFQQAGRKDLDGSFFTIKATESFSIKASFYFKGKIAGENDIFVDDLRIPYCSVAYNDLAIEVNLDKVEDSTYELSIPLLRIKDKAIQDILLLAELKDDIIIIKQSEIGLLGSLADVQGVIDFSNLDKVYLKLMLSDISLNNIVSLLDKENSVTFKGPFGGDLDICFKDNMLYTAQGALRNTEGGIIRIEKETSLGFLQTYFDEASYNSLIDNLKNYAYNEGELTLTQDADAVIVNLKFDSENLGKRNITISFHNILGGAQ